MTGKDKTEALVALLVVLVDAEGDHWLGQSFTSQGSLWKEGMNDQAFPSLVQSPSLQVSESRCSSAGRTVSDTMMSQTALYS